MNLALQIPAEHACYVHHFPGQTLVPGYLLLECVAASLERAGFMLEGVKNCKFLLPVLPGERGEITVTESEPGRLKVTVIIDHTTRLRAVLDVSRLG